MLLLYFRQGESGASAAAASGLLLSLGKAGTIRPSPHHLQAFSGAGCREGRVASLCR